LSSHLPPRASARALPISPPVLATGDSSGLLRYHVAVNRALRPGRLASVTLRPGPPHHHRCTGSSPQSRWSSTPPSSRPSARIRRAAAASTCQPQPRRRGLRPWCIACRRLDPLPLASAIGSSAPVRLRPSGHALHQLVVHARHVQQQDAVSEGQARPVFFFLERARPKSFGIFPCLGWLRSKSSLTKHSEI